MTNRLIRLIGSLYSCAVTEEVLFSIFNNSLYYNVLYSIVYRVSSNDTRSVEWAWISVRMHRCLLFVKDAQSRYLLILERKMHHCRCQSRRRRLSMTDSRPSFFRPYLRVMVRKILTQKLRVQEDNKLTPNRKETFYFDSSQN